MSLKKLGKGHRPGKTGGKDLSILRKLKLIGES
jgi:hypothetical protein